MVSGVWGKKIGMTQLFSDNKVIPVTVIDVGNWIVTGIKTVERDGYSAVQVGCLRDRYVGQKPQMSWMQKPSDYFTVRREIKMTEIPATIKIGQKADFYTELMPGTQVDVFGITKGHGFAGVVKRHGFAGGRASHGSTLGRAPGSMSFMRSQGRVIKGKRLPGHMGVDQRVMQKLDVIEVRNDGPIVVVKGSVPGHSGSLVFLRKRG